MKSGFIYNLLRTPIQPIKSNLIRPDERLGQNLMGILKDIKLSQILLSDFYLGVAYPENQQALNLARRALYQGEWEESLAGTVISKNLLSGVEALRIGLSSINDQQTGALVGGLESRHPPRAENIFNFNLFNEEETWLSIEHFTKAWNHHLSKQFQIQKDVIENSVQSDIKKAESFQSNRMGLKSLLPVEMKLKIQDNVSLNLTEDMIKVELDEILKPENVWQHAQRGSLEPTCSSIIGLLGQETLGKQLEQVPLARLFMPAQICSNPLKIFESIKKQIDNDLKNLSWEPTQIGYWGISSFTMIEQIIMSKILQVSLESINPYGSFSYGIIPGAEALLQIERGLNQLKQTRESKGVLIFLDRLGAGQVLYIENIKPGTHI
jgi:hypothetical protein